MSGIEILSAVVGGLGTIVSAAGTIAAGKAEQAAANYQAAQMDIKAKEEHAAAQREAFQLGRKKKLALSNLQARMAHSGGAGSVDEELIADELTEYGTMQEQMAAYGGLSRRQGLEDSAEGLRMTGKAAAAGAKTAAIGQFAGGFGTILEEAASGGLFQKFASPYGAAPKKATGYSGSYATGAPLDLSFGKGFG
jgi:hypothetical protein